MASTAHGNVFRSTNQGTHWSELNEGLPGDPVYRDIRSLAAHGLSIFAGVDSGVYVAECSSSTWLPVGSPFAGERVLALAVGNPQLFAGTTDGLWRNDVMTAVESESGVPLPATFQLAQNFPNPFNPATRIEYELRAPTHVRIDVFSTLGRWVTTLVDQPLPAGFHSTLWDGRSASGQSVASGVYFYRLSTREGIETRKMVLLR